MKKKILAALLCLAIIISSISVALADDGSSSGATSENGWVETTADDHYSISADGIITSDDAAVGHGKGRTNFALLDGLTATGNYTASVTASGTMELPNTKVTRMGIVPWYVDDQNYIICYLEWSDSDRPTDIRTVQFTGYVNNQHIGYNNYWLDGIQIPSTENFTFNVTKEGNAFTYEITVAEASIGDTITVEALAGVETAATVGVMAYNDTITFHDFSLTLNEEQEAEGVENGWIETTTGDHYTATEEGVITSDDSAVSFKKAQTNFMVLDDYSEKENYKISVTASGTMGLPNSKTTYFGVVPYYADDYNYLVCYIEWSSTDRPTDIREIQFTGYINGEHIGYNDTWLDGIQIPSTEEFTFEVEKTGDIFTYTVSVAGSAITNSVTIAGLSKEATVGVMAYNDTITFTDFALDINDEVTALEDDGSWKETSADDHYTLYSNGDITSDDAAVTSNKKQTNFYVLKDMVAEGNYTVSVTASGTMGLPNTKVTRMGVIPWYIDDQNYIMCYLEWSDKERATDIRTVQFTGYVNNTHIGYNNYWLDGIQIPSTEDFTFEVTKEDNVFTYKISVAGAAIEQTITVDALSGVETPATAGVMAYNDTITFTDFSIEEKLEAVENDGNWKETSGNDHYTLYTNGEIKSDGSTVNSEKGSTNFYILDNEVFDDSYTVSVTTTGTMGLPNTKETEMGLVPYYVDDNNYIMVYITWSNTDRPTDVRQVQFTGYINGEHIGYNNYWSDGVHIPSTNDIDFIVTRAEDTFAFSVSWNGTVIESGVHQVDGLLDEAKVGVMSYNDTVTFKNFNVMGDGLTFDGKTTYAMESNIWNGVRTVSSWIYLPESYAQDAGEIFSNYNEATKGNMSFGVSQKGYPSFYYKNGNGQSSELVFSNSDVSTGEWVHLVYTVDEATNKVSCYVNGTLIGTQTSGVSIKLSDITVPLVFGGDLCSDSNTYFKGHILESALYSKALTAEEVAVLYTDGVTAGNSLLAHYETENIPFDTNIPDASGNGNTLIAKPWYYAEKEEVTDYAYSFVVVGDTQKVNYADTQLNTNNLACIYDWIVANQDTKNIQFVFGLGDITDANTDAEWKNAAKNFSKLDAAGIPYSVIRGNHDLPGLYGGDVNVDTLTKYLGTDSYLAQYADGGFYGENNIINSWRTLTVGETDYLLMTLDYGASDEVLRWANEVVASHPEHRVIITTHAFMTLDGTTLDDTDAHSPAHGGYNSGETMWQNFISKHENIALVISGHIGTTDVLVSELRGDNGNTVTTLLIDPQDVDAMDGSTGMITVLYFTEDGKTIQVETYSTVKEQYYKQNNQFTFELPIGTSSDEEEETKAEWVGTAIDDHYTIDANNVITSDDSFIFLGPDELGKSGSNFYIRDISILDETYTVSVTAKGTMGLPNTEDVKYGIIPYYVDDNNFIMVYIEWSASDRATDIRCVQFSGIINGQHIGWNDYWQDGVQIAASEEFDFEVTRNGNKFTFTVSSGNTIIATGSHTVLGLANKNKAGVMACGDIVTFTDYYDGNENISNGGDEGDEGSEGDSEDGKDSPVKDQIWVGTSSGIHYEIDENGTITSDDSFIFLGPDELGISGSNFYILDNSILDDSYTVSATASGSMGLPNTKDVKFGIIPYYVDDNNFIMVYIEWSASDRATDIRCIQFSGIINGQHIGWNDYWQDGVSIPTTEKFDFKVTRNGDKFTFKVSSGNTVLASGTHSVSGLQSTNKAGVMACGDTVTFTNYSDGSSLTIKNTGDVVNPAIFVVIGGFVLVAAATVLYVKKRRDYNV